MNDVHDITKQSTLSNNLNIVIAIYVTFGVILNLHIVIDFILKLASHYTLYL